MIDKGCQLTTVCPTLNNAGVSTTCCATDYCNTMPIQALSCYTCTNCGNNDGIVQACPSATGYVCSVCAFSELLIF